MSAEEDTELRDLVAQTLETNGVLGKIRAQLRASVFLALEEQEHIQNKTPFLNKDLQNFLSTTDGLQVVLLIKEFLQFFKLEYTLAVFEPEVSCPTEKLEFSRNVLAKQLDLVDASDSNRLPLLASVLRQCKDADVDEVRRPSLLETKALEKNTSASKPSALQDVSTNKQANSTLFSVRKNSTGSDADTDSFFDDQFFRKKE